MDIRYGTHPAQARHYTTDELRSEYLIDGLYESDAVRAVYSHSDRMLVLGIMPVNEAVALEKGIDVWKNFGTGFMLERREAGFFNIGGTGVCIADGQTYRMNNKDCLYITRGAKTVTFESVDPNQPAKFYGACLPAQQTYETKLLTFQDAAKKQLGSAETANKRVINQFIHPDVLETAQLSMGLTVLDPGSVWNTMPVHTHERRMEVYTYIDIPEGNAVFHMMGQPQETRHILVHNEEAVISPSWSIHAGCGTSGYAFIWAMGGENQAFDDMDTVAITDMR